MNILILGADVPIGLYLGQKACGLGHQVFAVCEHPDGNRDLWEAEADFPSRFHLLATSQLLTEAASSFSNTLYDILLDCTGQLTKTGFGLLALGLPKHKTSVVCGLGGYLAKVAESDLNAQVPKAQVWRVPDFEDVRGTQGMAAMDHSIALLKGLLGAEGLA